MGMGALKTAFTKKGAGESAYSYLFCFDEARALCAKHAWNGEPDPDAVPLFGDATYTRAIQPKKPPLESFSHFRALRCALRLLADNFAEDQTNTPPELFIVFTDTTSHINNFQPNPLEDHLLRSLGLPGAGVHQFRPIILFGSIDVYARLMNDWCCSGDPDVVVNFRRLLRFGRAGWASTFKSYLGNKLNPIQMVTDYSLQAKSDSIVKLAKGKLFLIGRPSEASNAFSDSVFDGNNLSRSRNLLRLLAVMSSRLAITIGPAQEVASEMVSSHMA